MTLFFKDNVIILQVQLVSKKTVFCKWSIYNFKKFNEDYHNLYDLFQIKFVSSDKLWLKKFHYHCDLIKNFNRKLNLKSH
jgi:hypothetical protein